VRLRAVPGADHHQVELWVIEDGWEVPIRLAGAGRWEATTLSAAIVEAPGRVVVFDEPAVNIDPALQGKLLADLGEVDGQVLLITHSPLLVPAQTVDDLHRITRLQRHAGTTELRRLPATAAAAPDKRRSEWLQILSGSSDARAMLFAAGVVLVEGDTELGAFQQWFQHCPTAVRVGTPQARNIAILSVSGDKGFEAYVDYLHSFGIPWAIVCDGPILSLDHPGSVFEQLTRAGVHTASPRATSPPGGTASAIPVDEFAACQGLAEKYGVFTLAEAFTDEVEAALERFDSSAWAEALRVEKRSKVRRGRTLHDRFPAPPRLTTSINVSLHTLTATTPSELVTHLHVAVDHHPYRALACHAVLGLTVAQIRAAIQPNGSVGVTVTDR
jgi:AAA domain, putative AbiEii toxin, Type IV TA system